MLNYIEPYFLCFARDHPKINIRKVFDSISHNQLLTKLWSLGFHGDLWRWIKAYSTDRPQCVCIHEHIQYFCGVISVVQSSILGSLLFILYINDLPSSLKAMLPFYLLMTQNVYMQPRQM